MTKCTRCDGTGFLNTDEFLASMIEDEGHEAVRDWLDEKAAEALRLGGCSCIVAPPCPWCLLQNDYAICDCCSDGHEWYGTPGEHYGPDDPQGDSGPYTHNGGLCECH